MTIYDGRHERHSNGVLYIVVPFSYNDEGHYSRQDRKEAANPPLLKSHQVHSGQDIRNGTKTTQETANLRIREEKNGGSTDIWGQWDSSTCERKVEGRTR